MLSRICAHSLFASPFILLASSSYLLHLPLISDIEGGQRALAQLLGIHFKPRSESLRGIFPTPIHFGSRLKFNALFYPFSFKPLHVPSVYISLTFSFLYDASTFPMQPQQAFNAYNPQAQIPRTRLSGSAATVSDGRIPNYDYISGSQARSGCTSPPTNHQPNVQQMGTRPLSPMSPGVNQPGKSIPISKDSEDKRTPELIITPPPHPRTISSSNKCCKAGRRNSTPKSLSKRIRRLYL
ncbi:hypothetical protein NM688_g4010 [Phlebia brevispora]|uniref:Uncharacterized protein n=1 Tax=Phlebia brevispora TaxID=194682 RepID=A0ACC1T426_9APHY|nr:hypothetical protein NM688_g4010 [Phlebia brevispora]